MHKTTLKTTIAFKGKKEVVFYDNFDDDRNKWFEESHSPSYKREIPLRILMR